MWKICFSKQRSVDKKTSKSQYLSAFLRFPHFPQRVENLEMWKGFAVEKYKCPFLLYEISVKMFSTIKTRFSIKKTAVFFCCFRCLIE